jgi:hypothetical protein
MIAAQAIARGERQWHKGNVLTDQSAFPVFSPVNLIDFFAGPKVRFVVVNVVCKLCAAREAQDPVLQFLTATTRAMARADGVTVGHCIKVSASWFARCARSVAAPLLEPLFGIGAQGNCSSERHVHTPHELYIRTHLMFAWVSARLAAAMPKFN